MLLIVILILSQDQGYSQSIQSVTLGSVPWYRERALQKMSLGETSCTLLSDHHFDAQSAQLIHPWPTKLYMMYVAL